MKKNNFIVLILIVFSIHKIYSQTNKDLVFRDQAKKVLDKFLKTEIVNKNYLVKSFGTNMFFVVLESNVDYVEYMIYQDKLKQGSTFSKPNNNYKFIFNSNNYTKEFINLDSPIFQTVPNLFAQGSSEYFVLINQGKRYGEYRLPSLRNDEPYKMNSNRTFLIGRLGFNINNIGSVIN